jgi:hypothetical protein
VYAGTPELPAAVEASIRAQQNNDASVSMGLAAARILEKVRLYSLKLCRLAQSAWYREVAHVRWCGSSCLKVAGLHRDGLHVLCLDECLSVSMGLAAARTLEKVHWCGRSCFRVASIEGWLACTIF